MTRAVAIGKPFDIVPLPHIEETDMTTKSDAGVEHHAEDEAAQRGRRRAFGRWTQLGAVAVAAGLLLAFIGVHTMRGRDFDELSNATAAEVAIPPAVDVATVSAAPTTSELKLPGETAPWYGATIYARVDGYVARWLVDIGDHVRQGQVLAEIETPELDAELNAAEAKLTAAQADIQVLDAESRFADSTYRRWRDSPRGVVSEQETEDKKAGYESAIAKLAAGRAQVNLAQSEVDRLKAFETFKHVTAPFAGTITQRRIDIGNLVTAGSSASTSPLYNLVQDNPIRVFVAVPQHAVPSMVTGTEVTIAADGALSHSYLGKITRTSDAVDPQARTLRVEIDIPNPNEELVPGLYVEADFHLQSGALAEVPAAAMIFRTQGPRVALVDGDRVRFQDVTIAQDDGSTVALASGVKPDDKVVLNISSQIKDGDKVAVTNANGHEAIRQTASR
jgi:RND family efflux transporter MFP subunit